MHKPTKRSVKKLRAVYKSEKICNYYPNCKYGDTCKFQHIDPEINIKSKSGDCTSDESIEELLSKIKPIGYSGVWE